MTTESIRRESSGAKRRGEAGNRFRYSKRPPRARSQLLCTPPRVWQAWLPGGDGGVIGVEWLVYGAWRGLWTSKSALLLLLLLLLLRLLQCVIVNVPLGKMAAGGRAKEEEEEEQPPPTQGMEGAVSIDRRHPPWERCRPNR